MPSRVPEVFVVDLLEDIGMMDRREAELLMSWMHWVEMEVQGYDDLLEGLSRLKGALMAAATSAVGVW